MLPDARRQAGGQRGRLAVNAAGWFLDDRYTMGAVSTGTSHHLIRVCEPPSSWWFFSWVLT